MAKNPKLKSSHTETTYTKEQLLELKRCIQSPIYFIKNYIWVVHPKKGRIRFNLYDFQEELVKKYSEHRWNITMIARQSGKTETTAAFLLWYVLFQEDKTVLVAANKLSNAKEIVQRVTGMYMELPEWLKIGVDESEWNKTSIKFENNSRIIAQATSRDTGRGYPISLLYLDEFAFVAAHIQQEMWAAIQPTLATGGSCIISSTPNGDINLFAELWRGSQFNKNPFVSTFVKWDKIPGRSEKFKEEQIALIGQRRWDQEFECKMLSADKSLLNDNILELAEKMIEKPEIYYKGTTITEPFWFPIDNTKQYILGVDPSEGIGEDFGVIEVFEFPTLKQVYEYRTNVDSPRSLYSIIKTLLIFLAKNSKGVFWSVENNGVGQGIISLYEADQRLVDNTFFMSEEGKNKLGFFTDSKTKKRALVSYKELFEGGHLTIKSKQLLNEFKTLVKIGNTYKARAGATDDCVFATMIVIRILDEMADFDVDAYQKLYNVKKTQIEQYEDDDEDEDEYDDDDYLPMLVG